jgi:AcrR family transcriptional regulator
MHPTSHGERTKQELAEALAGFLRTTPFDKISIRQLTDVCGIRRQSFYYHFEDVYALLRYLLDLRQQALQAQIGKSAAWEDRMLLLFRFLSDHRSAYFSLKESSAARYVDRAVYDWFYTAIQPLTAGTADAEYRAFLCQYCCIALSGLLNSWLRGETQETPEALVQLFRRMLRDHLGGGAET